MPEGQKADPNGRQLEVKAQRAPRLLVSEYFLPNLGESESRLRKTIVTNNGQRPLLVGTVPRVDRALQPWIELENGNDQHNRNRKTTLFIVFNR